MPRIRFGQVHIVNCLYSSSVANYCVGTGYRCNAYVENCAFTSAKAKSTPWKNYATKSGYTDYNITLKGNLGANDVQKKSGNIDYFIPSDHYTYTAYDAEMVESVVSDETNGAGATLTIEEGEKYTTGIQAIQETSHNANSPFYNLSGQRVGDDYKGVVIQNGRKFIKR